MSISTDLGIAAVVWSGVIAVYMAAGIHRLATRRPRRSAK